jgi:hypothetical protein
LVQKGRSARSGRGGYFGPGNAQLPAPPMLMPMLMLMLMMMDRITEISLDGGEFGKGRIVAGWKSPRTSGSWRVTSLAIRS